MRSVLILLLALFLSGCYTQTRQPQSLVQKPEPVQAPLEIRLALEQQYVSWAGTPYRLGGTDRSGIDCSGFVREVFSNVYALDLPRSTDEQVHLGAEVSRQALQPSDLVFFRTGATQRHVGIYLGEGKFLHASTSRGVIISRLDNPYWKRNYWTARRLADEPQTLASL
ncbi:NlpC/P60 family protein [Nitrincola tapanii]|uniref:Glycoside hydrolase n=1 Tax=Nitrincola tapanii TaxID=1708751 RepID=A0A5A9W281_9GAMM|nr:NlpC/P60 family protein [Nitrincola tapanii]KAA0874702.1 glycoside hydrolase [Nitrincola tapanii]